MDATSYLFNRKFILAEELKKVTHEDVLLMFEHFVQVGGAKRTKLSSHIVGKGHSEVDDPLFAAQESQGAVLIGNDVASMDAFKNRCPLFPPVAAAAASATSSE